MMHTTAQGNMPLCGYGWRDTKILPEK